MLTNYIYYTTKQDKSQGVCENIFLLTKVLKYGIIYLEKGKTLFFFSGFFF